MHQQHSTPHLCRKGFHDLNSPNNAWWYSDGRVRCAVCHREARQKRLADPVVGNELRKRDRENKRHLRRDPIYLARRKRQRAAGIRLLKAEALAVYGGAQCVLCGERTFKTLTLDHLNGDGAAHRMNLIGSNKLAGHHFYRRLRTLGWPKTPPLRVLCAQCNRRQGSKAASTI